MSELDSLVSEVKACTICAEHLPLGPRPVIICRSTARILIVGQAPGTAVHRTGIPWNDPSGERLREWMGVSRDVFYEHPMISIMPMGFCYPGKGKSGDLPPRKECAAQWHRPLLALMPQIDLTLMIGQYSQKHYLPSEGRTNLTDTVKRWNEFLPKYFPLPHPSPRNNLWLRRNPWFEAEAIPFLQHRVRQMLRQKGVGA